MEFNGVRTSWPGPRTLNQDLPNLKPFVGFTVDTTFDPSEDDKMSTTFS